MNSFAEKMVSWDLGNKRKYIILKGGLQWNPGSCCSFWVNVNRAMIYSKIGIYQ
jgi:hypothetical protein